MPKTLDVYLNKKLVGHLIQDDDGQMSFGYSNNWLENTLAVPLSHSLPLRDMPFSRKECRGFFAGILPEENKRKIIARNLGISAQNDYAMLEQIGGECAGAVTFIPAGEPLPEQNDKYRILSETELADILRMLPHRPLLAGEQGVRLSLAGVQDKIAVQVSGDEISLPLGGAPSTHILKPAIERFDGVVFNEAYCMKLAARLGLPTAPVETRQVEDIDYLLVERYDRKLVSMPRGLLPDGLGLRVGHSPSRSHREGKKQAPDRVRLSRLRSSRGSNQRGTPGDHRHHADGLRSAILLGAQPAPVDLRGISPQLRPMETRGRRLVVADGPAEKGRDRGCESDPREAARPRPRAQGPTQLSGIGWGENPGTGVAASGAPAGVAIKE